MKEMLLKTEIHGEWYSGEGEEVNYIYVYRW